jgi:hypothetical protein
MTGISKEDDASDEHDWDCEPRETAGEGLILPHISGGNAPSPAQINYSDVSLHALIAILLPSP